MAVTVSELNQVIVKIACLLYGRNYWNLRMEAPGKRSLAILITANFHPVTVEQG